MSEWKLPLRGRITYRHCRQPKLPSYLYSSNTTSWRLMKRADYYNSNDEMNKITVCLPLCILKRCTKARFVHLSVRWYGVQKHDLFILVYGGMMYKSTVCSPLCMGMRRTKARFVHLSVQWYDVQKHDLFILVYGGMMYKSTVCSPLRMGMRCTKARFVHLNVQW